MSDRLERLRQMRRRYGAGAVLQHALDRLARRIAALDFYRLLWLEAAGLEPAPSDDDGLDFRFLSADEVRTLAADAGNCLDAGLANELATGRNYCFAALAGGRLAAYGWYALGTVDGKHSGQVALGLPADTAYFYNGFTRPEFRGRQVYARLMGQGLRALAGRGVRNLLASVNWTNWAALRSCRRLGFIDLGYIIGVGSGRFRLVFPPRAAKRRGIKFGRSASLVPSPSQS